MTRAIAVNFHNFGDTILNYGPAELSMVSPKLSKGWGNNAWCLPGHHDRRAAILATQDFLHSQLDPGMVPLGVLHHVYRFAA